MNRRPVLQIVGLFLLGLSLQMSGCQNDDDSDVFIVLGSGIFVDGPDQWNYTLFRIPNSDGGFSYVQWFPPTAPAPAPVVVMTEPYFGIDWTGEEVDERWAANYGGMGFVTELDVDGPDYVPGVGQKIVYELKSPIEVAQGEAKPYLQRGFGVLFAYGRFYAGGNIWNDVQDMVAALTFLQFQPNIDKTRVGISGLSWGGFLATYGAAYAPSGMKPTHLVSWAGPVDMKQFAEYITLTLANPATFVDSGKQQLWLDFMEPYMRRITNHTGGLPSDPMADYSQFENSTIGPMLSGDILLGHDEWDTLVPFTISSDLVVEAGGTATVELFEFPHPLPIDFDTFLHDHSQVFLFGTGLMSDGQTPWGYAYLLTRFDQTADNLIVPYLRNPHEVPGPPGQMSDFRIQQLALEDISSLLPRLLDLTDPRVILKDNFDGLEKSGALSVSESFNAFWGTADTEFTVRNTLLTTGIPP